MQHMGADATVASKDVIEDCFAQCDDIKQLYKWVVAVCVTECAVGVHIESRHITCSLFLIPLLDLMDTVINSQDDAELKKERQTLSEIWCGFQRDPLTGVGSKASLTAIDWLNAALSDELCKNQCDGLISFQSESLVKALQHVNTSRDWQTQKTGATNCLIQFAIFKKIESCLVESKRLWTTVESIFDEESEKQYFYLLRKAAQCVPAVQQVAFVSSVMLAFFGNSRKVPQTQMEELQKAHNANTKKLVDAVNRKWKQDAALLSVDTKTSKKQKRKKKSTSTATVTFSQTVVSEAANSDEKLIPQRRKRIAVKV